METVQQRWPEVKVELDRILHSDSIGILKDLFQRLEQDLHTKRLNIVLGLFACLALYLTIGHSAHFLCNFIGFIYPVCAFVDSIEKGQGPQGPKWMTYWVIYSGFIFVEYLLSGLVSVLPFYWLIKCFILVVCFLPVSWNGSEKLFQMYIKPFFQRNQQTIDESITNVTSNHRGVLVIACLVSGILWGQQFNCSIVGFMYPAYRSLKWSVNEMTPEMDILRWLTYWMAYNAFSLLESLHIITWLPLYWPMKFIVLMTCVGPLGLKLSYTILHKFVRRYRPLLVGRWFCCHAIHLFLKFRESSDRANGVRVNPPSPVAPAPQNHPEVTADQNTARKEHRMVDPVEVRWEMSNPMVQAVLGMDVEERMVKKAITLKLARDGVNYADAGELLDAVFNLCDTSEAEHRAPAGELMRDSLDISQPTISITESEDSIKVMEENRQLKDQKLCKICMEDDVQVVFVPCGHLVCCFTCTLDLSICPICRCEIETYLRTYMS